MLQSLAREIELKIVILQFDDDLYFIIVCVYVCRYKTGGLYVCWQVGWQDNRMESTCSIHCRSSPHPRYKSCQELLQHPGDVQDIYGCVDSYTRWTWSPHPRQVDLQIFSLRKVGRALYVGTSVSEINNIHKFFDRTKQTEWQILSIRFFVFVCSKHKKEFISYSFILNMQILKYFE